MGPIFELRAARPRSILAAVVAAAALVSAALGWVAWRLVQQDERLATQRAQERLEDVADRVVRAFSESLANLDADLSAVASQASDGPKRTAFGAAVADDGGSLLVVEDDGRFSAFPAERLLFDPFASAADVLPPAGAPASTVFARASALEFAERDYLAAAQACAAIAARTSGAIRAEALARQARNERKARQTDAALATYDRLAALSDVRVDGRPAALMARHATCALLEVEHRSDALAQAAGQFHEALYSGRWLVPPALFDVYAADAARWTASRPPPADEAERIAGRRTLSTAAQWVAAERRRPDGALRDSGRASVWLESGPVLVAWHEDRPAHAAILVTRPEWLEARRAAGIATALGRANASLALWDPAGHHVSGPKPRSGGPTAAREAGQTGLPWSIRVISADASSALGGPSSRRLFVLVGAIALGLVLTGGSYAMARAVVRELEAARMQSRFVATVSHEFRTPLSSIRHVADLLADARVPDEARRRRYYAALQAESGRLQQLVETLLDFRRMQDGARPYRLEPCDAGTLLCDVAARFAVEAERRGYTLQSSVPADLPPIEADADALSLAVWNLLDNAVKYSPDCPTVWLDARPETDALAVVVRDKGVGIPKSEARRVFTPFARGEEATRTGAGGLGLGLAIVRHIVEGHRGTVSVDSAPGEGTAFVIRVPFASGGHA